MKVSTLSHQELFRRGSSTNGCTVAERRSSDFLVNGKSLLHSLIEVDGGHSDFMGCFVQGFPEPNIQTLACLLLNTEPNTESGRVLLYICPECGDIACGSYSVAIEKNAQWVTWKNFAFENGYENPRALEGVGPFIFELSAYEKAVSSAAAL